jgi:hypothetical protein
MADKRPERRVIWCSLLLASLAGGCRVARHSNPPGLDQTLIQRSVAVRGWLVHDGQDHVVGSVVRYEEPAGEGRFSYSVRNVHGQDMGMVDQLGRAYRFRPHADPEWLNTGVVEEGALAILSQGQDGSLREISLKELEAETSGVPGH